VAVGGSPRAPVAVASVGSEHARVIDTPTGGPVPSDGTGVGARDEINGGVSIDGSNMAVPAGRIRDQAQTCMGRGRRVGQRSALRDRSGRCQETSGCRLIQSQARMTDAVLATVIATRMGRDP